MAKKEHPITEWIVEKILKDTGSPGKPFYSRIGEIKKFRLFGILLFRANLSSNFPDSVDGGK